MSEEKTDAGVVRNQAPPVFKNEAQVKEDDRKAAAKKLRTFMKSDSMKKLNDDKEACQLIVDVRKSLQGEKRSDAAFLQEFLTALNRSPNVKKNVVLPALNLAKRMGGDEFQLKVARKRVPNKRTPWEGEWDIQEQKFVPTNPPDDWKPKWWIKSGEVSGPRYCESYQKATTFDDLMKEYWFVGSNPKEVKAYLKEIHNLVNEWAERNNIAPLPMKRERKSFFTQKQAAAFFESGLFRKLTKEEIAAKKAGQ